jgi:MoxR-like ATPase
VKIDYPAEAEERAILAQTTGRGSASVPAVMNAADVLALRALVRDVHVSDDVLAWITRLVRATRPGPDAAKPARDYVRWGAGPRAGQALVLAGKARALLEGRLAVTREDVRALAAPVLRHRLLLSYVAEAEQRTPDAVIADLLDAVPFPG